MSSLPSTPERLASPFTLDLDNDSTQQTTSPRLQRSGPCNQTVRSPACPGSTRPVSPQATDSSSDGGSGGDKDKENICPSNFTKEDDPYCTANLHLLWQLATGAVQQWGQDANWPAGVEQHGLDIFMVNATRRPETLANLSKYLVDKIPAIFGTLKAWENELIPHKQYQEGLPQTGAFMEDIGGFTLPERTRPHTNALPLLQKEQVLVA
jgi:hypothetical protein